MSELDDYRKILKDLAAVDSGAFINNSSIDHAATMIEELFRNAKGLVKIVSGLLNPDVYDRPGLLTSVREFLEKSRDNKISIILQQGGQITSLSLASNNFIVFLNKYRDQVDLYKVPEYVAETITNHFMVLKTLNDNYAWRFEIDTKAHIANGSFNNGSNGEKLSQKFDDLVTRSEPILFDGLVLA